MRHLVSRRPVRARGVCGLAPAGTLPFAFGFRTYPLKSTPGVKRRAAGYPNQKQEFEVRASLRPSADTGKGEGGVLRYLAVSHAADSPRPAPGGWYPSRVVAAPAPPMIYLYYACAIIMI
jgi:hypothetical protein